MEEIVLCLILLGFTIPQFPGILGAMIEYYVLGGKIREERERRKWQRIDEIEKQLKKEGKTIHDEIKLAREGKSKFFKVE